MQGPVHSALSAQSVCEFRHVERIWIQLDHGIYSIVRAALVERGDSREIEIG